MKVSVALGVAVAALAVAGASAQSSSRHVIVNGESRAISRIDANDDGWVTRNEASAAFESIFADLDTNDDGKLDDADRHEMHINVDVDVDGPNVRIFHSDNGDVRVIHGDLDEETEARIEAEVERAVAQAEAHAERAERHAERIEREVERAVERAERDAERAERQAERAERHAERSSRHVQRFRDGDRQVIIIRDGEGGGEWTTLEGDVMAIPPVPPVAPAPPVPPIPAMPFMMLIANSEEADRNGDGALSREEFVAMHLRFFDASDVNGDGRVQFDPPTPPTPPVAPAPPEPPRRR